MFEVCLKTTGDPAAIVSASRTLWERLSRECSEVFNVGAWGLAACEGMLVTVSYWEAAPAGIGGAPSILVRVTSPPSSPEAVVRLASLIATSLRSALGGLGYVSLEPSCPPSGYFGGKLPY